MEHFIKLKNKFDLKNFKENSVYCKKIKLLNFQLLA